MKSALTIRLLLFTWLSGALAAEPLSKSFEIDFSREVLSRDLKGLAVRSDGRLLPGPGFTDLEGPRIADILWCLKPAGPNRFLVGTGPEGQVHEVIFNPADSTYTTRSIADVAEAQAVAVLPLPGDGALLGTSPTAVLYSAKDGQVSVRVPLPADSVFDLLDLGDGTVLAATGNPGKIYRIDLAAFAQAGVTDGKVQDEKELPAKGVTLFGEIRDRNVRRLARLSDGRIAAGSSPKGTVYVFPAPGASSAGAPPTPAEPVILYELRATEVVDLLPDRDGGLYAAFVTSPSDDSRIAPRATILTPPRDDKASPSPAFSGRSTVMRISRDGFAETAALRTNIALYRLARHNGWLLFTAGEQGDAFGYDPEARRSLTFAGSSSAQLNDLAPLGDGRYLVLRNNAPGLALLSFAAPVVRQLETKRLDLGQPAELGNLRFGRTRNRELGSLRLEVRTNNGSDELEGWTPWTEMKPRDGAFFADSLRGRYVKLRLRLEGAPADFQLEKATLFHLSQNHRPQLSDFRIFPPSLGLLPQPDQQMPSAISTLGQWLSPTAPASDANAGGGGTGDRRKNPFLNSQVVPAPGTQIIYWSVSDPDGDTLAYTFSIRPEKSGDWSDLAVETRDSYCQFEVGHLPEGLYLTRLKVEEQAPRPVGQRLSYVFETDALLVDRTPPVIVDTRVRRSGTMLGVRVEGRDELSLLEGVEFNFNNGLKEVVTQPADGIRDGRHEIFAVEIPLLKAGNATSVEVILYDQSSNAVSARVQLK